MTRFDDDFDDHQRFSVNRADAQIAGYLYKRSSSGQWQKRFFETSGSYLTYYKSHKLSKVLAAISVPQVGAIRRVDRDPDSQDGGILFELELKDRLYLLRARSEAEAAEWIDFLTDLRDGNLHHSSANPLVGAKASNLRAPKQNQDPPATAQLNKSTRINLCSCSGFH